MKIAVLVEDNYEELELWYPYYRLLEEGIAVDIVGPIAGKTYKSKSGYPAESNKAADKDLPDFSKAILKALQLRKHDS